MTTKGVYNSYIIEIKNKKLKVYVPSLEIEHSFFPVSPKLFNCNEIIENENTLTINETIYSLYDKIRIEITPIKSETKFNKKLYVKIVDLNSLNNI